MKKNQSILILALSFCLIFIRCSSFEVTKSMKDDLNLYEIEKSRVITVADKIMKEGPITITSSSSPRSAGGKHDFFSQSDYWWPDPKNPEGPYIRKDGLTNPDNFVEHRRAMVRLSLQVPALVAAYKITNKNEYALKAIEHLKDWFIDEETKMNPHLEYAQAVMGVSTGRGVGIIDAIHLVEVAQSIILLDKARVLDESDSRIIKKWFSDFLLWMTTSKNGIEERDAKNNHGTCWVMQVAEYAKLVGDKKLIDYCRERYKTVLLPTQLGADGSFPLELVRTKPYSYSIFNLDVMTMVCQILTDEKENLFNFTLQDGRSIKIGMEFLFPFIADKSKWSYPKDVMYFDVFPNRQPFLFFGGLAFKEKKYLELWNKLNSDPQDDEVIRNFPIRQPVVWVDQNN
jgi:hypothetical protein